MAFTSVGFAHIKIVAGLGTESVAAIATGHRVFFLIQAVLMGVCVGTTAIVARHWGAKDLQRAEMATWTAMAISMLIAAILCVPVLIFPDALAGLFGLDTQTTALAASFIFWLGIFNVFSAVNMMLSTALRATGDVITPLWYLLVSSTLNIVFAYLLAYGHFGLPRMGVAGVGLGGGFAGAVVTCLFAIAWWRGKFTLKAVKRWIIDWPATKQLLQIATPSMLEQGFVQISFLAFFAIVAQYGTNAYAAYGIGITLVSFSVVVGFGFGIAAATLVGQQLGAGNSDMAIAAGWRALRMAVVAMTVFSIAMALNAKELAAFMIDDPDVIWLTEVFIYMIAICQPVMAVVHSLAGALRGAGDTRFPLLATVAGIIFGRLIPALIFLWLGASIYWIFSVMVIDYIIKASLLVRRYRSHKWLRLEVTA